MEAMGGERLDYRWLYVAIKSTSPAALKFLWNDMTSAQREAFIIESSTSPNPLPN
jgi:hypothetical protein